MSSAATANAVQRERHGERILELLAVVILGMATLGSAWCAYQASRWNSEETTLGQRATDEQVEASRLFGLATQAVSYDTNLVAQYAEAVTSGNERLKEFYRTTLIRPDFLPVLDRWEAQLATGGGPPTNLLEDSDYLSEQLSGYNAAEVRAQAATAASDEAGEEADHYVLLTLVFASALFFTGVTSSFRMRTARLLLLVSAVVLMGYAASRLATLPVT